MNEIIPTLTIETAYDSSQSDQSECLNTTVGDNRFIY